MKFTFDFFPKIPIFMFQKSKFFKFKFYLTKSNSNWKFEILIFWKEWIICNSVQRIIIIDNLTLQCFWHVGYVFASTIVKTFL